jgi:hypothetical protein
MTWSALGRSDDWAHHAIYFHFQIMLGRENEPHTVRIARQGEVDIVIDGQENVALIIQGFRSDRNRMGVSVL